MVFGNMGDSSATGVAFTRNPATGENLFYGEWLVNAQGEDVVAGIRTQAIERWYQNDQNRHLHSMQESMPSTYKELVDIRNILEKAYKDMLDIEFTIQEKKLYMLNVVLENVPELRCKHCNGLSARGYDWWKNSGNACWSCPIRRSTPPICNPKEEVKHSVLVKGLPAGPGAAVENWFSPQKMPLQLFVKIQKAQVILLREETNPEDVEAWALQLVFLLPRCMTSHAALVARGWGKCCIVGAGKLHVDAATKKAKVEGTDIVLKEGDIVTWTEQKEMFTRELFFNGCIGKSTFKDFMKIVDKFRTMGVRTNAETPNDAQIARNFGAEGIGLFRTSTCSMEKVLKSPYSCCVKWFSAKE